MEGIFQKSWNQVLQVLYISQVKLLSLISGGEKKVEEPFFDTDNLEHRILVLGRKPADNVGYLLHEDDFNNLQNFKYGKTLGALILHVLRQPIKKTYYPAVSKLANKLGLKDPRPEFDSSKSYFFQPIPTILNPIASYLEQVIDKPETIIGGKWARRIAQSLELISSRQLQKKYLKFLNRTLKRQGIPRLDVSVAHTPDEGLQRLISGEGTYDLIIVNSAWLQPVERTEGLESKLGLVAPMIDHIIQLNPFIPLISYESFHKDLTDQPTQALNYGIRRICTNPAELLSAIASHLPYSIDKSLTTFNVLALRKRRILPGSKQPYWSEVLPLLEKITSEIGSPLRFTNMRSFERLYTKLADLKEDNQIIDLIMISIDQIVQSSYEDMISKLKRIRQINSNVPIIAYGEVPKGKSILTAFAAENPFSVSRLDDAESFGKWLWQYYLLKESSDLLELTQADPNTVELEVIFKVGGSTFDLVEERGIEYLKRVANVFFNLSTSTVDDHGTISTLGNGDLSIGSPFYYGLTVGAGPGGDRKRRILEAFPNGDPTGTLEVMLTRGALWKNLIDLKLALNQIQNELPDLPVTIDLMEKPYLEHISPNLFNLEEPHIILFDQPPPDLTSRFSIPQTDSDTHTLALAEKHRAKRVVLLKRVDGSYLEDPYNGYEKLADGSCKDPMQWEQRQQSNKRLTTVHVNDMIGRASLVDRTGSWDYCGGHLMEESALEFFRDYCNSVSEIIIVHSAPEELYIPIEARWKGRSEPRKFRHVVTGEFIEFEQGLSAKEGWQRILEQSIRDAYFGKDYTKAEGVIYKDKKGKIKDKGVELSRIVNNNFYQQRLKQLQD